MYDKEQIIEDARKILDNSFSLEGKVLSFASSQTTSYYAHCKEQIRDAMVRMMESNCSIYKLSYCCLGNSSTYETKNKTRVPNKEYDTNWDDYFVVDYSLIVKTREVSFDYLYQRIVNDNNYGVFLWFNVLNEEPQSNKANNNEISW